MPQLWETGLANLTWGHLVMFALALILIYLGIARKMEPLLLVPIGFGIMLANLPLGGLVEYAPDGTPVGVLARIFTSGVATEVIPLLIFLGLGAMSDFAPTIANPVSFIFGAAGQLGVFVVFLLSLLLGFDLKEAAAVGVIGGSDGPPAVYVAARLAPDLIGPITLSAYSYMALVPIVQPPIIRLLTTKKERAIPMKPQLREVSRLEVVVFPLVMLLVSALLVPKAAPLIGMLMFGNLLRVSGVTGRLAESASGVFIDVLTFLLGLSVGALMTAELFLRPQTLAIIGLAAVAFVFSTAGGVFAAKVANLFLKQPLNPVIGAAGVSAVPMSARVVQRVGQQANPRNFLLMHALGCNMAGVIGTSVVAGVFLGMVG
jgi:oxaloacetate decarboxylase beta subunit